MQDLTLVGVHDDGEHLVLAASDGQRFRVRVDEAMRAAVRRDRPRLGQLQIELDGKLRPRDIQARIRTGETAEGIAEGSGLPIEYVRRYEGPVLAEREFVVRQARAVRLRASAGGSAPPTLEELVSQRLSAREVDPDQALWDAWRVEDGTWVVTLTFTAGTRERRAQWGYDAQLRHVTPQDDEARWLTDDIPAASPGAATHRRLVPIRSGEDGDTREHVFDVEADGSVQPTTWPAAATVDLLDTLRERRGRRQRPVIDHDHLDRDEAGPAVPEPASPTSARSAALPPAAHPPASRPELADDAEVLELPDAAPNTAGVGAGVNVRDTPGQEEPVVAHPAGAGTSAGSAAGPVPAPATRRGKRASVPSWDDIVFGGRRE